MSVAQGSSTVWQCFENHMVPTQPIAISVKQLILKNTEGPVCIPKAGCSGIKHFLESDLDSLLLMINKVNQHKKTRNAFQGNLF